MPKILNLFNFASIIYEKYFFNVIDTKSIPLFKNDFQFCFDTTKIRSSQFLKTQNGIKSSKILKPIFFS